jgi:lysophospholipase L1-like esterase
MEDHDFPRTAWHERTPQICRRIARALAFDLCGLALLFAAGELAVRAWVSNSGRFLYGESITAGHPIQFNSQKLREREFSRARRSGEIRILCLGDSVTFGSGLPADAAWPRQLETQLQPDLPDGRVFVINAAGQGRSLGESIDLLKDEWLAYEPSLVVLGFSPWMAMRANVRAPASRMAAPAAAQAASIGPLSILADIRSTGRRIFKSMHSTSRLCTLAAAEYRRLLYRLRIREQPVNQAGGLRAYAFDAPGVDQRRVEAGYESCQQLLREMKTLLDAHGVPLAVVTVPSRFELSSDPCDNEFQLDCAKIRIRPGERMSAICRELGIPHLDLRPALQGERSRMLADREAWDDLYVDMDYTHLNGTGCRIAAGAIRGMVTHDSRLAAWRRNRPPTVASQTEAGGRGLR